MKRFISTISLCLFVLLAMAKYVTPAASLPAYYEDLQGKSGSSLFYAVQDITQEGYSSLGYDGLWNAYPYTDVHDNGYVWDMYSDCTWKSISSNRCGNYSDECDCFNREHSIPKSWYGGTKSGPGCDIFHVVPTDGKVNGMRSSFAFGEVSNATYNKQGNKLGSAKSITIVNGNTIAGKEGATISCSASKVFEPRDEYKGDFARGYLGSLLRWAGEKNFTDGDGGKIFTSNFSSSTSYGLTKYGVALLMKWHRQDPVSKKEVDRNNGIQQTQGNRNPFIDYPYLAEYIWGEKSGQAVDMDHLLCSADSRFVLGESNGYLADNTGDDNTGDDNTGDDNTGDDNTGDDNTGDDNTGDDNTGDDNTEVEQYTITWIVNGEEYTAGDPTVLVNGAGVVRQLPTAPTSCDEESNQFVGWSETTIDGTTDEMPEDLFSTADDAPDIMQSTVFYAIFAKVEEKEVTTSANGTTVGMSLTSQTGWTLSGLIKDTKHWRVVKNAYILSPEIDLSQVLSIVVNLRTYGGSTYNTLEFSMDGTKVGELKATTNKLKEYTWTPSSSLTGVGQLRFSSSTCTAENGPALSDITIKLSGKTIVYEYSRYMTDCEGTTTDLPQMQVTEDHATKIIRNGQLVIEHNGMYYNTLGQPINY